MNFVSPFREPLCGSKKALSQRRTGTRSSFRLRKC
jgi:hypothetical protein